jgi:hypothetical protein
MTPYYDEGGVTIYHADFRDVSAWVGSDVLVTDPPEVKLPPCPVTVEHPPTHLVASSSNTRRALCGERDPFPFTRWDFLPAHHQGHGRRACQDCAAVLGAAILAAFTL